MRQVAVEGMIWSYEEIPGQGVPIVILHGWGRTGSEWLGLAKHLSAKTGRRIVVPDLPGFGGTTLPRVQDIYDYTELLVKYLAYLEIKRASIVGHSLGGRMGVVLGLMYPGLIEKLVLIAPAGVKPVTLRRLILSPAQYLSRVMPERWRKKIRSIVSEADGRDPRLTDLYRAVVKLDLRKKLSGVKAESHIIFCELDQTVPLRLARIYREEMPDARVRVIWESGHDPHLSHPRELARTVEETWI